ncbi:integrator complex subunit 9 [Stutzerimonas balearica]|uniref:integrator complex subunit 9 n=1 Tax=Stutzerimonas balearica TaxID=74829 RepID=UPI00289E27DC|nr:integrator complex subunit 9 [Stutzerimonas balearica]
MLLPDIEHHGAADGVTGSCHQLHMDADNSLLIDCGLFQGNEAPDIGRAGAGQAAIEFDLATVRALIVTHVHIDHVGRLPQLLAAGFNGPIFCSEPSAKLLPIVLEDAFKLGVSRDQKTVERYIQLVERRMQPLPYGQWFTLLETDALNVRIRQHVEAAIANALSDQGSVLILTFNIGRTQDLLYELEEIIHSRASVPAGAASDARTPVSSTNWSELPIILDALAHRVTEAYRVLQLYWSQEVRARADAGRAPQAFDNLTKIDSRADHIAMVEHLTLTARPTIFPADCDMCPAGRGADADGGWGRRGLDQPRLEFLKNHEK